MIVVLGDEVRVVSPRFGVMEDRPTHRINIHVEQCYSQSIDGLDLYSFTGIYTLYCCRNWGGGAGH